MNRAYQVCLGIAAVASLALGWRAGLLLLELGWGAPVLHLVWSLLVCCVVLTYGFALQAGVWWAAGLWRRARKGRG